MAASSQVYGITLPIRYGERGFFAQSYTMLEQVRSNLNLLLQTRKGERRMNPEFGSGVWNILFENIDDNLNPIIENTIRKDIARWMPYVSVSSINISTDPASPNKLGISVEYTVPSIGATDVQSLQVMMSNTNPV